MHLNSSKFLFPAVYPSKVCPSKSKRLATRSYNFPAIQRRTEFDGIQSDVGNFSLGAASNCRRVVEFVELYH